MTRLRDYLSAVRLMWAQIADLRAAHNIEAAVYVDDMRGQK